MKKFIIEDHERILKIIDKSDARTKKVTEQTARGKRAKILKKNKKKMAVHEIVMLSDEEQDMSDYSDNDIDLQQD